MPGLNETSKNLMLDELGVAVDFVSIHDDDPGVAGDNEVAGSDRQSVTWSSASGGTLSSSGEKEFNVTSGTTVHSVGFWSAATGGTFYGSKALPQAETFSNDGVFTINNVNININDVV